MFKSKNIFASTTAIAAMTLSVTSAFALNEGDSDTFTGMNDKLAAEQQEEIIQASTGSSKNVRGVKFYYNQSTRIGYIILTNDSVAPSAMKIIRKTTNTNFSGPVIIPQPIQGIQECKKIVDENPSKKNLCGSLYSSLKSWQDLGFSFYQQGKLDNGNNMITLLNMKTISNEEMGQGVILESTPNGATLQTLIFSSVKSTPEGARLLQKSK